MTATPLPELPEPTLLYIIQQQMLSRNGYVLQGQYKNVHCPDSSIKYN
jgi:hypothetical protein